MKKLLCLRLSRLLTTSVIVAGALTSAACSSARNRPQPQPPQDTQAQNQAASKPRQLNTATNDKPPGATAVHDNSPTAINPPPPNMNSAEASNGQMAGMAAGVAGSSGPAGIGQSHETFGQTDVATEEVKVEPEHHQIPTVTEVKTGADVNRMTLADFEALGLTQDQAQMVIQYRATHGPFSSPQELAGVPTLDQQWLQHNLKRLGASNG